MPLQFAPVLRACCVAGALMVCGVCAAEPKPPLVGATRAQILARFGEPKSQIVAGNREVLFFNGERIVLRDGVAIEADEIAVDVAPPEAVAPASAVTGSGAVVTPAAADTITSVPATKTSVPTSSNAAPDKSAAVNPTPGAPAARPTAVDSEAHIISIRPPSKTPLPVPTTTAPMPVVSSSASSASPSTATPSVSTEVPAATKPVTPVDASVAVVPGSTAVVAPVSPAPTGPAPSTPASEAPETRDSAALTSAGMTDASPSPAPAEETSTNTVAATNAVAETSVGPTQPASPATVPVAAPAKPKPAVIRRGSVDQSDGSESVFTAQTYVIAFVIIVGGVGYLVWRARERRLAMVATAVSRSPFAPDAPVASSGARFTADLLGKLEWKRFEELVASYYNKTGVVATRSKTGPASPVHIKISWKGEPRPFAFVQCIAHPPGLIEPKPIQSLCEVLAAENIRRGYVVTSGKFGVSARDLAEEKHVTLLTGDIFQEKLNALPDAARNELMREASSGDYLTPTCPQCDIKMVRAPADSSVWQCAQCGTVLPRA